MLFLTGYALRTNIIKENYMNSIKRFGILRSACALTLAGIMATGSALSASANANDEKITTEQIMQENKTLDFLSNTDTFHVLTAYEVTVDNCGTVEKALSDGGTVGELLDRSGIFVDENQIVVPNLDTKINSDITVKIIDGKNINVTADGETKTVLLGNGNIVEALNAAGYNVSDDDILNVSRYSNTEEVSDVTIQRVTYVTKNSTEKIKYETEEKKSDKLDLGDSKVEQKGEDGEKQITTKYKYVDGKEDSKTVVDSKVVKEAVNEIKLIGTKGASSDKSLGTFTDSNGTKVSYTKVLTGSGTAYTAPAGAGTATGVPAYHGGVAVNPNIIPYGSKLYIESTDGSFVYGYATAVDTGGALMDGSAIVDCFYNTYDECVTFGRRNVNVYIIG